MVAVDDVTDLKKINFLKGGHGGFQPPPPFRTPSSYVPNSNVQPVYQYNKLAGKIYADLKNALTMLHKAFWLLCLPGHC